MGYMVIACYRPKPGCAQKLLELVGSHLPLLRAEGLATERAPMVMRASDGSLVEVFEWASREAVEEAHDHPRILELWGRFDAVSEYVPMSQLPESQELFAHFEPVSLRP